MVYNLPLDAFASKDWWGTAQTFGGTTAAARNDGDDHNPRAGLIPTQTGCVNGVAADGTSSPLGALGERHNGALTLQLIRADTPYTALELNVPGNVKYGWRVRAQDYAAYVLAEYTSFWHHPNGKCYGKLGWVPNPPQDFTGNSKAAKSNDGTDPKGVFGQGGSPGPTVVTNADGSVTTTYADGTVVIRYPDGRVKTTLPGGEVVWRIPGVDLVGAVDLLGGGGGPGPVPGELPERINWRELRR
jgi:hypothetical protein